MNHLTFTIKHFAKYLKKYATKEMRKKISKSNSDPYLPFCTLDHPIKKLLRSKNSSPVFLAGFTNDSRKIHMARMKVSSGYRGFLG